MLTSKEFRRQEKECLELADQAKDFYVNATLIELAREFARAAHQAERRERAFQMYGAPERLAVAHSPR